MWLNMLTGIQTEKLFHLLMLELGKKLTEPTKDQDIFEHWDRKVNGLTHDVKGEKCVNRHDSLPNNDLVLLEYKNVRGNTGWLKGKESKLVFMFGDVFEVYDRRKLASFADNNVDFAESDTPIVKGKLAREKVWYRRPGKKDLFIYFPRQSIAHLVEKVYQIPCNLKKKV